MPEARLAVVTSDTLNTPEKIAEFVANAETGLIDVIVGTQLVTKGYHFPELTLVGVVDADLGLEGGDLRAGERTYQQIAQVSGRAGRGAKPGKVLIQTRAPVDQLFEAATEQGRLRLLQYGLLKVLEGVTDQRSPLARACGPKVPSTCSIRGSSEKVAGCGRSEPVSSRATVITASSRRSAVSSPAFICCSRGPG